MTDFLWQILPWGYQVLLNIEALRNGPLNIIFRIITEMGGGLSYLFILAVVYWSINKSIGHGLAYSYLISNIVITWLKNFWSTPRPDNPVINVVLNKAGITKRLVSLVYEPTPAFPSGHAFQAIISWGYMAAAFKKTWFWILAGIMALLIGFSRLYLGVHYPQDVIAGWIFGVIYLVLWRFAEPYVRRWLTKLGVGWQYVLAVAAPLILLAIFPVHEPSSATGAIVGLGIGFVLEGQTVRFSTSGSVQQRIWRTIAGFVPTLILYIGLKLLFSTFDESMGASMSIVWHVLRYGVIGLFAAWGAPWLFIRTGLAKRE